MLIPTVVMGVLAAAMLGVGYWRGEGQHVTGLKTAVRLTLQVLPLLAFAFVIGGMAQALLPAEVVSPWLGGESGLRGIFIGTFAGVLTPGGPYVSFPLAAGFLKAGASVGTVVAYLTAWSICSAARLPMQVGIMGWKPTLIYLASTFFFPPIAGLVAQAAFAGRA